MILRALIFSIFAASVATAAADPQQEFTSLFKKYTAFKALTVKFTQEKHVKELKTPLKSNGVLQIDRATNHLTWELTTPSRLKVEVRPDRISIETGSGTEIRRQTYSVKSLGDDTKALQNLSVWMDFNPEKIVANYTVTKVGAQSFQLEPKVPVSSPFKKLIATASTKGDLSHLEMTEPSDDTLIFNFEPPTITKK